MNVEEGLLMVVKSGWDEIEKQFGHLKAGERQLFLLEQAQARQIKQEEILRGMLNAMHSGIILVDVTGTIIFANKRVSEMFGYEKTSLLGMEYTRLTHDSESRDAKKNLLQLISGQINLISVQRRYQRKDGSTFTGQLFGRRLRYPDGEFWVLVGEITDITVRRQIEEDLQFSQQKLAMHMQQTPLAVMELDLNFDIVSWNPAAEKIFGFTAQEIIGQPVSVIVPPVDQKHIKTVLNELVTSKNGTRNTNRNIDKDGNILFCEWFNTAITDESAKMISFVCLGQNITERVLAEKALRVNEERYRELFENMTSGVAVFTAENNGQRFIFKGFNSAAERITGVHRNQVIGRDAMDVFPGLPAGGIIDAFSFVFHTGKAKHIPEVLYQGTTLSKWADYNIYKLPSGDIVAVFNDVTYKKQTENKLQIERDKLESVINGMGDMLYIVNKNYRVEFQNHLSKDTFGNLIGKTCYKEIFKQDLPCAFCRIEQSLSQNRVQHSETPTIDNKTYEISFSPYREMHKEARAVILIQDITEKTVLQADAMRAAHLASLGELAAGVAHEINNPVTGIISLAEIMTSRFEELGGDKKIPERIINEAERISRIVGNLLSFARVHEDNYTCVNINRILENTLELVGKQVFKDGIHLSVSMLSDLPRINANDQEIQQVMLNLISNARYALNEKYPECDKDKVLKIKTRMLDVDSQPHIRILFSDHGVGIDKKIIKSITNPFFSTKPPGKGTGLGLSISHGIINNHGGRLLFDSRLGEYTTVSVDLPVKKTRQRTN